MIKWYAKARLDAGKDVSEVDVDFLIQAITFQDALEIATDHIENILKIENYSMVELRYVELVVSKEEVNEEVIDE